MSIVEIENAIKELPAEKVKELMESIAAYQAEIWDMQMASDVDGGSFDPILEEVDADIDSGIARPL